MEILKIFHTRDYRNILYSSKVKQNKLNCWKSSGVGGVGHVTHSWQCQCYRQPTTGASRLQCNGRAWLTCGGSVRGRHAQDVARTCGVATPPRRWHLLTVMGRWLSAGAVALCDVRKCCVGDACLHGTRRPDTHWPHVRCCPTLSRPRRPACHQRRRRRHCT